MKNFHLRLDTYIWIVLGILLLTFVVGQDLRFLFSSIVFLIATGIFIYKFNVKEFSYEVLGFSLASYFLFIFLLPSLVGDIKWLEALIMGSQKSIKWPFTIQSIMWLLFFNFIFFYFFYKKHHKTEYLRATKDRSKIESEFQYKMESIQFIAWTIPTLGFLGTVIGMSMSLNVLGSQADLVAALDKGLMQEVLSGLGVAFNTTILGFAMNIVCMFMISRLNKNNHEVLAT